MKKRLKTPESIRLDEGAISQPKQPKPHLILFKQVKHTENRLTTELIENLSPRMEASMTLVGSSASG